jgi:hypothetical protein
LGTVLVICTATVAFPVTSRADDVVHRVTYTVTADQSLEVDIYYRDVDPPNWSDYSHNPYEFSPKAEAHLNRRLRGLAMSRSPTRIGGQRSQSAGYRPRLTA